MSRQFTSIRASKPAPKKKLVRPMPKMSQLLHRSQGKGFKKLGS